MEPKAAGSGRLYQNGQRHDLKSSRQLTRFISRFDAANKVLYTGPFSLMDELGIALSCLPFVGAVVYSLAETESGLADTFTIYLTVPVKAAEDIPPDVRQIAVSNKGEIHDKSK